MSILVEIDETDLIPINKQLTYKLERIKQYLIEAQMGMKMDNEEGEFLLGNGLSFALSFTKDALMITKGPDFIDWM